MKFLWIVIVTIITLNADEVQRIESILNDITKLRANYEFCQENLDANAFLLKDEKDKNSILIKELNSPKSFYSREKKYEDIILKLNKKIIIQDELLKAKDKENAKLEKKYKELLNKKIMKNLPYSKKEIDKKISNSNKSIETKIVIKEEIGDEIEFFKASAFRLNKSSIIYSDLNGTYFDKWDEGTSFTSGERTKSMIKITGYFINKKWGKATKEMWIEAENTNKR